MEELAVFGIAGCRGHRRQHGWCHVERVAPPPQVPSGERAFLFFPHHMPEFVAWDELAVEHCFQGSLGVGDHGGIALNGIDIKVGLRRTNLIRIEVWRWNLPLSGLAPCRGLTKVVLIARGGVGGKHPGVKRTGDPVCWRMPAILGNLVFGHAAHGVRHHLALGQTNLTHGELRPGQGHQSQTKKKRAMRHVGRVAVSWKESCGLELGSWCGN